MTQASLRSVLLAALLAAVVVVTVLPTLVRSSGVDAMSAANAFGWLGGAFAVSLNWPQAHRLWVTRQYAGLAPSASVLGVLVPSAWFAYGVAIGSPVQYLSNGAVLLGAVTVLIGHVSVAGLRAANWAPMLVTGYGVIVSVAVLGGAAGLGSLATLVTLGAGLPQLVYLVRRRIAGEHDTRGVSLARIVLILATNLSWLAYGVLAADAAVLVTNVGMVAVTLTTFWLVGVGRVVPVPQAREPVGVGTR